MEKLKGTSVDPAKVTRIDAVTTDTAQGPYLIGNELVRVVDIRVERPFPRHAHNYEHPTRVVNGEVDVMLYFDDEVPEVTRLKQGEEIIVPARIDHSMIAIDRPAKIGCYFKHRDFDGNVVDHIVDPDIY